jgi:murein DD-endopeptidase MepM/ murein hydrolase activator NlpD
LVLILLRMQGTALTGGPPILEEPDAEIATFTNADTLHRGDTLAGLLLRNRVGLSDIESILKEIRFHSYFDPRALLPGQILEFTRNESGGLVKLVCKVSPEQIFVFETDGESMASFAQAVDSEVRVRKFSGEVRSSFEEAVRAAGGSSPLAIKIADVFSCEVDFFTEVRKGDRFAVLVEERYVEDGFVGYGDILYGWYQGDQAVARCAYFRPTGGKGGYYDLEGRSLRRAFLKSPLNYRRISSHFTKARFHPILKKYRPHHGVDYAASEGTPIVAVADGVVEFAGWKGGYGKYLKLRHNKTHETCYGHLSRIHPGVKAGSHVKQGDRIGYVGRTGLATGSHLHYEVIENGRSIDPLTMKTLPSDPIANDQLAQFRLLVEDLRVAEAQMASGAILEPNAWQGLLAQNTIAEPAPAGR